MTLPFRLPSRRSLMYGLVAVQLLVLGGIVLVQEVNRVWDAGPGIPLEFSQAFARRDPFKGAYVSGRALLDLSAPEVSVPGGLRPGETVRVVYAVTPDRQPQIVRVEPAGRGGDPLFTTTELSLRGTVRAVPGAKSPRSSPQGLTATIGTPAVTVALHLPASIPVDEGMLDLLAGPSLIEATLRQGYLGHRYFTDVRLTGRALTEEAHVVYDEGRDRLLVLAPLPQRLALRHPDAAPSRQLLHRFDGVGNQAGGVEFSGHLLGAAMRPQDGTLWGLLAADRWTRDALRLVRIEADGQLRDHGPPVHFDRILGFDAGRAALWVLSGERGANRPPFFVERLASSGRLGPRFGPFASRPTRAVSRGAEVWILEASPHRLSRFSQEGRLEQEYRDLNQPSDLAPDAGGVTVIDAGRTQLSRFSRDGRLLWRVPRFQGLNGILPDGDTGGGWVGALRLEAQEAGLFRYEPDGRLARLAGPVTPRQVSEWQRSPLGVEAYRSTATGRFYLRERQGLVILAPDGSVVKRLEGMRFDTARRVRQ